MEKKISYLNRNYEDYKNALINFSKTYYPGLAIDFNDASVGSWLIDLNSVIADELSYHIDRVYQETNINSANEASSVYAMARNAGFKIPGPKGAMAEVMFSCYLPIADGTGLNGNREPDWNYAPIIKAGTRVSSSRQSFELLQDIDFNEQFNNDGESDRTIVPEFNSGNQIVRYRVTKLAVVVAGETRVYKKEIRESDIKPFLEVLIPVDGVMNVESVIVKDGTNLNVIPTYGEFYMPNETSETYENITRFFEVDYLAQQNRWGEVCDGDIPVRYEYSYLGDDAVLRPVCSITKGEWKPLKHKFMSEYTDKGYLKLIFGAGVEPENDVDLGGASDFSRYQISRIIKNNSLGVLPKSDSTMFVLYRVGGGRSSNVAKGAINTISTLKFEIPCRDISLSAAKKEAVMNTVSVVNTTPSVSGKDTPTTQEIKYLIKYNAGAQERCVTVKDYISRVLLMPPKYGTPFRVGASEENNKIMLYILGLDENGHLDAKLPTLLVKNILNYLKEYRMINDFVEIKSGRIVNLSFYVGAHIDKNYNSSDVKTAIKNKIKEYMDVNAHNVGEDIFTGDLQKEITKIDGVINIYDFRVYNEVGPGYSATETSQEIISRGECFSEELDEYDAGTRYRLDLTASEGILYSDGDTMLEIKEPTRDIKVDTKSI